MSQEEQKRKKRIIRIGRYSFFGVVGLWLTSYFWVYHFGGFVIKNAAELGDSFGSLNALFSGLAFAGLIYTILLQQEELRLQRKELKETKEEIRKSAKAQAEQADNQIVAAKLQALNTMLEVYSKKREVLIEKENIMLQEEKTDNLSSYTKYFEDRSIRRIEKDTNYGIASQLIKNQHLIESTEAEIELILANLYVSGSLENKFFTAYFKNENTPIDFVDIDENQFRSTFGLTKRKYEEWSLAIETDEGFLEKYHVFRQNEKLRLESIARKKLAQEESGRKTLLLDFFALNNTQELENLNIGELLDLVYRISDDLLQNTEKAISLRADWKSKHNKFCHGFMSEERLKQILILDITRYIELGEPYLISKTIL